jgi:putative hydrolase of the HAD superfamily
MRAVIFDLFSTLVSGGTDAERADATLAMGKALGLDPDAFASNYHGAWRARFRGEFGDLQQTVRSVAAMTDPAAPLTDEMVDAAVRIRLDLLRGWLTPAPHSLSTLETLRTQGWRLGLLSNCAKETEELFPETALATGYFEVVGLSSALGVCKPDPHSYRWVATGLGVEPSECIFVGDGADGELAGAAAVGCRPIRVTELVDVDTVRVVWGGETMASLTELPALIGLPAG